MQKKGLILFAIIAVIVALVAISDESSSQGRSEKTLNYDYDNNDEYYENDFINPDSSKREEEENEDSDNEKENMAGMIL
ncbi:hypothetical protein [Anaerosinus sp.]|uniref:hypothetical protein n=1 Tax=Selenobaculum sp. TaxID=3074374 RepID=UPI0015B2A9E9